MDNTYQFIIRVVVNITFKTIREKNGLFNTKLYEPLLSVIIPVYNAETTIMKCISSICNQDYKNIEIIVVNDGSMDNSKTVIENAMKKDNRIVLINQKNKGVSAARNMGLCSAKGNYITFVDADDYVGITTYNNIIKELQKNKADAAVYAIIREFNHKEKIELLPWDRDIVIASEEIRSCFIPCMIASKKRKSYISGSVCRTIYRTEKINDLFFNELVHIQEDLLYCIQSYMRLNTIYVVNSEFYHYVKASVTTTEQYRKNFLRESLHFEEEIVRVLKKFEIFDSNSKIYCVKRIGMYSLCVSNLFRFDAPKNIMPELNEIVSTFKKDVYLCSYFNGYYLNKKKWMEYILLKLGWKKLIQFVYCKKEKIRHKKLVKE